MQRQFKPNQNSDHLIVSLTMRVKIGVEDYTSLTNCGKLNSAVKDLVILTGAEVEEVNSFVMVSDPFCGSQREKFLEDRNHDELSRFVGEI